MGVGSVIRLVYVWVCVEHARDEHERTSSGQYDIE
jgi:hypothetical protein